MNELGFTEEESGVVLNAPIPGSGLTTNPDEPKAWETPPEYNTVEEFTDALFTRLTSEENRTGILDSIRKGVPLEDIGQLLLFQAFSTGKITPDLQLLAVEPVIYMLIWLAEWAGIPNPVLFPEDEMLDDEEETLSLLEKQAMEGLEVEEMEAPKGISKGLLAKLKEEGNGN